MFEIPKEEYSSQGWPFLEIDEIGPILNFEEDEENV